MGKLSNLTDHEFLHILRENAGLYARTARAIEKKYGMNMTRQAIKIRAGKFTEEVLDIREENLDIAEESLHSLMRSKNEKIRLQAVTIYLKTVGKGRGYTQRYEFANADDKPFAIILDKGEKNA